VPVAASAKEPVEEVVQKDFAKAVKIWRGDIKPARTKVGDHAQEQSTAYKAIKKDCHIQPQAAKLAFKVSEMEDAHRDDFLICLNGLFKELGIVMPRDLVTIAEGDEGGAVIPEGTRKRPKLVTVDDDFEAPEEEIAGQASRPSAEAAKAAAEAEAEAAE
jgi:hypothetical protein